MIHEGHLEYFGTSYLFFAIITKPHSHNKDNGRPTDCYAFLFNDMFLITKTKKSSVKSKVFHFHFYDKICMQCFLLQKGEYSVYKQPVPLDSCIFCDADSDDSNHQSGKNSSASSFLQVIENYELQCLWRMPS